MKITVVTSYSPKGYADYGRHFLTGFDKHWPREVDLVVYTETDDKTAPRDVTRHAVVERNLLKLNEVRRFRRRHRADLQVRGQAPTPAWKDKERRVGYSFRTDAYKFFRKPMAIWDAVTHLVAGEDQWLVWIDADTRWLGPPPAGVFDKLLPDGADVTYLSRPWMHSECGWAAFRLPSSWGFVDAWADLYRSDQFKKHKEWHDSYLFDRVREKSGLRFVPINDEKANPHPWHASPLTGWSDHLKGPRRKARGWSIKPSG